MIAELPREAYRTLGAPEMNMPRYSEADVREFQRCFGGHARESLQRLVAMQSRVRPGDEPQRLIGLSRKCNLYMIGVEAVIVQQPEERAK